MWNRKDIKKRGLAAFTNNYVRCLIVALVLGLIIGTGSSFTSGFNMGGSFNALSDNKNQMTTVNEEDALDTLDSDITDGVKDVENKLDELDSDITDGVKDVENKLDELDSNLTDGAQALGETLDTLDSDLTDGLNEVASKIENDSDEIDMNAVFLIIFFSVIFIITAIIVVFAFAFEVLVANPFEVGCKHFFYSNLNEKASFGMMMTGFTEGYSRKAKTLLLRDIYEMLWSCLFIIPGIVKSYEYRMIPYILSVNPEITTKEAFKKSKDIMTGNKWKVFIFDLSFIGWDILNIFTLGILGVFFLHAYRYSAQAALFEELSKGICATKKEEVFEIYTEV